jgi:hypothetical protein
MAKHQSSIIGKQRISHGRRPPPASKRDTFFRPLFFARVIRPRMSGAGAPESSPEYSQSIKSTAPSL